MLILIVVSTHPRDGFLQSTEYVNKHQLDYLVRFNLGLKLELPTSKAMKGAKNVCRCTGKGLVK
jgi:hypothetical protein